MRHLKKLVLAAVVVVVLVVGGTWVYINVIREDAPERLTLERTEAAPAEDAGDADGVAGEWAAGAGSEAGYRVDEILFGQDATAVGRTTGVTGSMAIEGTTVTTTDIEVDMTSITSDQERRDNQFHGRIMDTATHPTATFSLREPLELGELPASGATATYEAVGELTLRGTTKQVTVGLSARRNAGRIEVQGSIPIVFEEWGIPNPSTGPITTEDHGELEFLVVFARA